MNVTVTRIESFKLLRHPMTWVLVMLTLGAMTLLFFRLCVDYLRLAEEFLHQRDLQASLSLEVIRPLCSWTIVIIAIIFPVFTTYAISQELRSKTFYLWAASPVRASAFVIGKFLSILSILLIVIAVMLLMIATLSLETNLDWGMITTSVLAVGLIGTSFISFGLFLSSVISYPLLAIVATFIGNAIWMLLEWLDPFPFDWFHIAKESSLLSHSYHLLNGIVYSPDIVYYALFDIFWLLITIRIVYKKMTNLSS